MNSTIYYIPEAKAQPSFHLNQSNYHQVQNQQYYYQNQPNFQPNQSYYQQSQQNFYQNQTQPNIHQSQLNFPQQSYSQPNQYNPQQSQYNYQQNQSTFVQNQPNFQPNQSYYQQSQQNSHQVQPNNIQQSIAPFIPSESHHSQQSSLQQAKPDISQSFNNDQNQSKYPQLEPTFQQENPNVMLNSFAPLPKPNLLPTNMLPNVQNVPNMKTNKFGIAIDITGENSYEEDGIKFTLYNIQGYMARKGEFSTTKGYKDFVNIHLTLINLFPGSEKYLRLPDKTHFLKLNDSNIHAIRDGLATFLKSVACSNDFFFCAEVQNFLFTGPAPAKQQVDFLKQQNQFIMYNNPAMQTENVSITILRQFEKQDLITSHIEYSIIGNDPKGQFEINRRYSDFVLIREVLVGKFPKVPFMHLPVVTSSGQERLNGLIAFLKSIAKIPFVYHSIEWQIFIRYKEADVKKKLKPFKKSKNFLEVLF